MIEIKFRYRVKHTSGNIHVHHFTLDTIEKGIVNKDYLNIGCKIIYRDQYAGITDRNGNDVYENDRIKEHPNGHIGIIKKDMGNFYVEWDNSSYPDWSWNEMVYDHTDRIEVIGTIYNDKRLTNDKKQKNNRSLI